MRYRERLRAPSTRLISSSMIGLPANGTKRIGAMKVTVSPNMLGVRRVSVTRGGFIMGE